MHARARRKSCGLHRTSSDSRPSPLSPLFSRSHQSLKTDSLTTAAWNGLRPCVVGRAGILLRLRGAPCRYLGNPRCPAACASKGREAASSVRVLLLRRKLQRVELGHCRLGSRFICHHRLAAFGRVAGTPIRNHTRLLSHRSPTWCGRSKKTTAGILVRLLRLWCDGHVFDQWLCKRAASTAPIWNCGCARN